MRDMRDGRKTKDITHGKRDVNGNLIKEKKDAFKVLIRTDGGLYSFQLDMDSWPLAKWIRRKGFDTADKEQVIAIKSQSGKNCFHPCIWSPIDVAGKQTHHSGHKELLDFFKVTIKVLIFMTN